MFLFNANAHARNPAAAGHAIEEIVNSIGGELLVSRLWNEQKLAYPVQGHRKGAYWLTYIKAESTKLAKFNRACKLNETILRHLAIKLDPRLVDPLVAVAQGQTPSEVIAGDEAVAENKAEAVAT
jgi:small subunit ribosomal protein S6